MNQRMFEYKKKINDWEGMEKTLEGEHGMRLESLLAAKASMFIHLDQEQLSIVNTRKKELFINLKNTYKEV